ncbi:Protein kinase C like superfamily [Eptesicus fuscus gammaherpesvirus]|uniref:Protein kinase C like superfamily n=1 Tax=vespertilionid gammaherpesvirus 3 TaxID=2846598 RepID=A0A2D1AFA9_9GAMA|nr:Protein kinase C like superfamily [Eptesicus fuscus gammaherpesvirus]ATA58265.1 Protein kinase C like superfamily [Eptesicus fuscus gammaherpesvirus]WAH70898.1 tegument serine/threonine protein kinase [Eptesicus fuscus gammaherpesvirus]
MASAETPPSSPPPAQGRLAGRHRSSPEEGGEVTRRRVQRALSYDGAWTSSPRCRARETRRLSAAEVLAFRAPSRGDVWGGLGAREGPRLPLDEPDAPAPAPPAPVRAALLPRAILPSTTILDTLMDQASHIRTYEVSANTVSVRLPRRYLTCCAHAPMRGSKKLGEGVFGTVYAVSDIQCVKSFLHTTHLYQELLAYELVALAKTRASSSCARHRALIAFHGACVPCRVLMLPRYRCSLEHFPNFSVHNVSRFVAGFEGLLEGVRFLNADCGLFHSDITPCNILVAHSTSDTLLGELVLSDYGVCSLHSGNARHGMAIRGPGGHLIHRMYCTRDPFYICKDAFKPAMVLAACYATLIERRRRTRLRHNLRMDDPCLEEDELQRRLVELGEGDSYNPGEPFCGIVTPPVALAVDVSCLAYCLIYVVERLVDMLEMNPTDEFIAEVPVQREQPMYYLRMLAPKVVMLKYLAEVWRVDLDLGVSPQGCSRGLRLERDDAHAFAGLCKAFKERLDKALLPHIESRLRDSSLRAIALRLLSFDFFNLLPHAPPRPISNRLPQPQHQPPQQPQLQGVRDLRHRPRVHRRHL